VHPLGYTRTVVRRSHALIAPDSQVISSLPGWKDTRGVVLISPAIGARFTQYYALLDKSSLSGGAAAGVQRLIYVIEGDAEIDGADLAAGAYAYFPPDHPHRISTPSAAKLLVFEKRYESVEALAAPPVVMNHESEMQQTPFMGDDAAQLKLLLPDTPAFDMAVNIFTYQPGAMLPQVECHVMEHGLVMLAGMGVYRLDDHWYPVQAGDAIWMAAYCPQWFIAGGKTPARYIYYKDINRDAGLYSLSRYSGRGLG
jgi:(S)-ureidoglycine aminohydrolase